MSLERYKHNNQLIYKQIIRNIFLKEICLCCLGLTETIIGIDNKNPLSVVTVTHGKSQITPLCWLLCLYM